jgi:AcrR family transcriptional regulator
VLDAARLVFAVHGPDAPMSAVAQAAGVGMGSLYRRFPSKVEMVQYLCEVSLAQQVSAAETALAGRAGPWDALAGFIGECVSFRAGVFSSLAGAMPVTAVMTQSAQRAHTLLETLVAAAHEAGALRADAGPVDVHYLIGLFSRRPPGDEEAYARLLRIALDGLRAAGSRPLPGSPPDWATYARRWAVPASQPGRN